MNDSSVHARYLYLTDFYKPAKSLQAQSRISHFILLCFPMITAKTSSPNVAHTQKVA